MREINKSFISKSKNNEISQITSDFKKWHWKCKMNLEIKLR